MTGLDLHNFMQEISERLKRFSRETLSLALATEMSWHIIDMMFQGNDDEQIKQIKEREVSLTKHLEELEAINRKFRASRRLERRIERLMSGKIERRRPRKRR